MYLSVPCGQFTSSVTVPPAGFAAAPSGSLGQLLPNTEARLIDPVLGVAAEPGAAGELWLRGPQVMSGYLDNPEATAATLVEDGWLRTGDLVRVDEDGHFWLVDRLEELIRSGGHLIAPAELESVLLRHPGVREAAVVGIPHDRVGETPKAFVVAARMVEARDLVGWVADRVASHMSIQEIEFTDHIPKSPSGGILRWLLPRRSEAMSSEAF